MTNGLITTLDLKAICKRGLKKKFDMTTKNISQCRVAVHIRQTDYKDWKVLDKTGVTLPLEWYRKAINLAASKLKGLNPCFFLFSDEPEIINKLNLDCQFVNLSTADPINDFLSINMCEHAIISASSFSYTATLLSYYPDKLIIAPKYWLGFKSNTWCPANFASKKILHLPVS